MNLRFLPILMLAGALPALAGDRFALTPEQREAFGVRVQAVATAARVAGKAYPGKVTVPNDRLRVVSAPKEGVVQSLHAAEGQEVDQGEPLATLNSPDLISLQRDVLEARTRFDLAEANYRRDQQLDQEGIIAGRRLLESRADYQEAQATLAQRRQALGLAGMSAEAVERLERSDELNPALVVRAPLGGVVLEQMATAGQRLAAADPIYRIGDLSTLWVEVHVPLEALGGASPGDRLRLPDEGVAGEVITVGRMVHGADQGVLVRAAVTEGAEALRPGQFVQARLESGSAGGLFRIPDGSVVRSRGGQFVFVEAAEGFEARPVEVVSRGAEGTVVRAGLEPDAQVVSEGTAALKAVWLGGAE